MSCAPKNRQMNAELKPDTTEDAVLGGRLRLRRGQPAGQDEPGDGRKSEP